MKTQIVYVLVANESNLYLEELWVSLYSLRQFHPEVKVNVLVDEDTDVYIRKFPELMNMITNLVVVPTPQGYNAKQRSRQIKTTVREVIEGNYLFIDTDTVICKPLDGIDNLKCDIAAVPDGHQELCKYPYKGIVYEKLKRIWNEDISDAKYWYNSGVMYVSDSLATHEFYQCWNKEWTYSCFEKGDSQDQPALLKVNKDKGFVIENLPDVYNAQVSMCLTFFADAAIVHWWHMNFIDDQSYSPYLSMEVYKELKREKTITSHLRTEILNCKSSWAISTIPVGLDQMLFLFTDAGKHFVQIYKDGGVASVLMLKVANLIWRIHQFWKTK